MRIRAAALAGGIFGVVGTLCFLVAFSTDYWLIAKENCGSFLEPTKILPPQDKDANGTEIQLDEAATVSPSWLILHHEGFFWRCMFAAESSTQAVLATFFTNQPEFKVCVHGYLFPLPVALGEVPEPIYDATAVVLSLCKMPYLPCLMMVVRGPGGTNCMAALLLSVCPRPAVATIWLTTINGLSDCFCLEDFLSEGNYQVYTLEAKLFRGFWTVLIIVGLVSALTGGLLLLCGVPFISDKLYKLGGAFLITAACLFLFVLLLFVLWMEVVDVKSYILQERGESCPDAEVFILYGLSFMVAAAGIPLEVLSGLLFLLVGRALRASR